MNVKVKYVLEAAHDEGLVSFDDVSTSLNTADVLTKALPGPALGQHRDALGLM